MYREISRCRICGNPSLAVLLSLGEQHLTGVFPKSIDEPVEGGPLELVKCAGEGACGLAQLRHSFEPGVLYGDNYGYRSGLNQTMVRHLQEKADAIQKIAKLQPGDLVLDIGSNDGTLLRAMKQPGVDLVGMDPTGSKFRKFYPEEALLIPEFFSASRFHHTLKGRRARVVTSLAMFYDMEAPMEFMAEVSDVLTDDGVWVFEQSYLPLMLKTTSYDTICHEHLEYYALKQIVWMAERVGFTIIGVEVNQTNGGSFSVVAAKSATAHAIDSASIERLLEEEASYALDTMTPYQEFAARVMQRRSALIAFLEDSARQGKRVLGYGASTKGNVLLQYCGITPRLIPSIAEVNSDKFGCFTPGSLIPIISEAEARALRPDVLMVLPWHFRDSIIERERGYLESGGKLLFPLPSMEEVVRAEGADSRS